MTHVEDRLDHLESLVEQQQETIATQRERIADLEREANRDAPEDAGDPALVDRRDALKAGGLLALLFGGVGTASADAQGQVGTSSDPLQSLHTDAIHGGVTGETELTSLLGDGLALSDGALAADLQQVGSGTGVLGGVSADGIAYRSLSGSDGVSLSSGSGTISVGLADTETETTTTFAESEVTVRESGAFVDGGVIRLFSFTVTRPEDNSSLTGETGKYGLRVKPKRDLSGLKVRISKNTTGASDVYLIDSDINELASEPFPGPDDEVTLSHQLSANEDYYLFVDNGGSSYTVGLNTTVSFPYESSGLDINNGYTINDNGIPIRQDTAYSISDISAVSSNDGSATVEWDEPASVSRWETAAFQADGAGETVDVYVETSSDGGATWSDWSTNPIAPGTDLSAIPSDDRIRFRVELSREDESNEPRLTQLTRQWRP
jgi:hypothetical protein